MADCCSIAQSCVWAFVAALGSAVAAISAHWRISKGKKEGEDV